MGGTTLITSTLEKHDMPPEIQGKLASIVSSMIDEFGHLKFDGAQECAEHLADAYGSPYTSPLTQYEMSRNPEKLFYEIIGAESLPSDESTIEESIDDRRYSRHEMHIQQVMSALSSKLNEVEIGYLKHLLRKTNKAPVLDISPKQLMGDLENIRYRLWRLRLAKELGSLDELITFREPGEEPEQPDKKIKKKPEPSYKATPVIKEDSEPLGSYKGYPSAFDFYMDHVKEFEGMNNAQLNRAFQGLPKRLDKEGSLDKLALLIRKGRRGGPKIYRQSEFLTCIVENHGWNFYELGTEFGNRISDLERMKPSEKLKIGFRYILLPTPGDDQSLEEAVKENIQKQPTITIDGDVIPFTRVEFGFGEVKFLLSYDGPTTRLPYTELIKTFVQSFSTGLLEKKDVINYFLF